jgi:hypothetical protein
MLAALFVLLRMLGLLCAGHRAVALENLALRQQLAVFKRTAKRPPLHRRDRLFWILLAKAWPDWRTALIVVQPDTSCVGIANGSGAVGPIAQLEHVRAARAPPRPFGHSSTR